MKIGTKPATLIGAIPVKFLMKIGTKHGPPIGIVLVKISTKRCSHLDIILVKIGTKRAILLWNFVC